MKIYSQKTNNDGTKKIKVLGITIYKKTGDPGYIKRKYFGGIFKTIQRFTLTKYYFLGIGFFKRRNKTKLIANGFDSLESKAVFNSNKLNEIINTTQIAITVANQHQKVFPQFKNIHKGKECVIVATGPTLNYYEPIENAIHIGVNSAFKKVDLDYFFSIDYTTIKEDIEKIQNANFIKFYGQCHYPFPKGYYYDDRHIPNQVIENSTNAYKYYFNQWNLKDINTDIETQLLPDLGSSIFSTVYFALYTGVTKIYLVGCDCASSGHWNNSENTGTCMKILPDSWKVFKEYASVFYPDVEIVSINPVGLKGLFEDIYTQSYIDNCYSVEENNEELNKKENVFYLKVNSEKYFALQALQNWVNVAYEMDSDFYIICDKENLKNNILNNIKFKDSNVKFIQSKRVQLNRIIKNITTKNWENPGYSHLTTFYHAWENGIKNFWNIDADDTTILSEPQKVKEILKAAQSYAENHDISAFSLDMWRSRSRSKQWTFGITYTKDIDKFIQIFNTAKNDWKKKYEGLDDGLNIDWFITYLADNNIIKAETFYVENLRFIHWAREGAFFKSIIASHICYWKENKIHFPILENVLKDPELGVIPIAKDCIKFDLDIKEEDCLKFLRKNYTAKYSKELTSLWHLGDSKYAIV